MRRIAGPLLLFALLVPIAIGCLREPKISSQDPATGNLVLILPESAVSSRKERVPKLWVDGVDLSEPRATKRTLQVEPAKGTDKVKIVYSFWPVTYSNTIRTKVVTLPKGDTVTVDFSNEDKETPDQIKPIYFPTPYEVVHAMCELGKVGPTDVVHDIGSGDGRLVILAVKKFGAKKGLGIDIDPDLVTQSRDHAKKDGVQDRAQFRHGDALEIKDFSEASVVLLYVGEDLNLKLKPILQKTLKPGSRVVSHRFLMGKDWEPDKSITIEAKNNYDEKEKYNLHLWTIR